MPQMAPHMWIILVNLTLIMMMTPLLNNKTINKSEKSNKVNKYTMNKNKW